MSATKKILRKEIDRLKKALNKVLKPENKTPQLVLEPVRPTGGPYRKQ